jgi:hypothetical protein
MKHADVCRMAQALARNLDYAVFPCGEQKKPTRPEHEGGHGFKDATKDPDRIAWLWQRWPGPLIGIATGAVSNRIVLDLDTDHNEACAWYHRWRDALPPTQVQRTRRGGLHFYFLATEAIRCSTGRADLLGIDVRGEGGYAISWYAAGLPLVRETAPLPWPTWLTAKVQPPKPVSSGPHKPWVPAEDTPQRVQAAIEGLCRKVASEPEGNRNSLLNWAGWMLRKRIGAGQLSRPEAEFILFEAARSAGLNDREVTATVRSALREV